MADPLGVKAVAKLPILDYDEARDQLQTGDIVFCSGTYFFSKTIQWFTRSVWSHIGVIYRDDNLQRIFVLESETAIGVRLVPLSKYVRDYHGRNKPYKGRILIARIMPEPHDEKLKAVISFGMDELTRPYDNWEIFRIAMRIPFQARPQEPRPQVHLLGTGLRGLSQGRCLVQVPPQLDQPGRHLER